MIDHNRLYTELVCYANGAELIEYSENLAIDKGGELIQEIHVRALISPVISEITITLDKSFGYE